MTQQSLEETMLPAMATIRGDLRDLVIGAMAGMAKPWKDLPEADQTQLANMIDAHAASIVTRIAILTATAGRPVVMVTLDSLSVDERARGHFTVSKELAPMLVPYTRQIVAITAIGANQFMGERAPARIQPDQPGLPMDGGGGAHLGPPTVKPGETKTITIVDGAAPATVTERSVSVTTPAAATPRAPRRAAAKVNGVAKPRVGSPFAR